MSNSNGGDCHEYNKIVIPNEETVEAMIELDERKGKQFDSVESLMEDLRMMYNERH